MNRNDMSVCLLGCGFDMSALAAILRMIMANSPNWISKIEDKVSSASLDFIAYCGIPLTRTFELIGSPMFFVISLLVFALGLMIFQKDVSDSKGYY